MSVWIDWSNNGFDALDLLGTQVVSGSGGTATFDITPTGAPGYVRMRVACTYAELNDACGAADYGHAVDFALSIGRAGWPCYPLYASGTSAGDGIDSLVLQSYTYHGLLEFPYASAHVENEHRYDAGASDVIQIRSRSATPNSYTLMLDMNNDGDFNDPQELVGLLSNSEPDQLFNFNLDIPAICPPGQHWLRVRCHPGTAMLADPCQETGFGNMIDVLLVVEDPNGPCIPYSPAWTTDGDFIDGVQLGGAQNLGTGGPFGPAYSAYLSPAISVIAGVPDTLRITGGAFAGDSYSAWIDYNGDNDFDDANELLGWIGIADPYAVGELPFTVPNGTVPGNKRMRVRCSYGVVSDACATMGWGETEDYTVYIETSTGVLAATIADLRLLPTTDGVQLLTDASLIGNSYLLLDATGRTLATGRITADRTDLPMIDFARGAYTVQVLHGDARQVKRFVW
ncbi:MAG: T9SS type A sorting domain-containing protein [Flavobacteriales bacterium]|nr:T9SS type A sorting domain-containing protein [Flavobacteriales bacterium]